jgi:DNA-binding NarL/FixJ family response regulator
MNAETLRPRVLLAEPDLPTRAGLKLVVERGGLVVAGEAADAAGAVGLAVAEGPDLALVAAELPGRALQAIRRIAAGAPGTRVIVFTAAPSGQELLDAVLAGAAGYVSRDIDPERLSVVLRAVLDGEVALPRRLSRRLVDALRGRDARRALVAERAGTSLTDREWEILDLLAAGRSTAEIAHRLGISAVTARRHISSLVGKLGVADRAAAVQLVRSRSSG